MVGLEDVPEIVYDAVDYHITLITDDEQDDEQVEFLQRQGFNVTKFYPGLLSAAGQDTIDMLNAADLIIVGRSPNSGDFDGDDKPAWNNLTAPLIINSQWVARSSRINMFNSTNAYHMNDGPAMAYGVVSDPLDPIFDGLTLDGDSLAWCLPPHDFIENADSANNGEFVAVFNETSPLIVRWDAGTEYYPGAGDAPAGPRTYFGFGNDNAGWPNFFPLTKEAKKVYVAEICRMIGLEEVPEMKYAAADFSAILITDDEEDDPQFNWLRKNGVHVEKFYPGLLSAAGQDTIDMLNMAELIIVGRSPNSGDFESPDKEVWNALTPPLIINSQWVARSSRINMFNSTSAYHMNDGPEVAYAVAEMEDDVIFSNVTLVEGDSLPFCLPPHDFIENADSANNGDFVAVFNETSPLIVRWEAGIEYYPGAVDAPAGPRTFFGLGNDNVYASNFFPLTDEGQQVYWNEISRMLGAEMSVVKVSDTDASLASLEYDVAEAILTPEFDSDIMEYTLDLPEGTTEVRLTAIANSEYALSVEGDSTIDVSAGEAITTQIVVTAENGGKWFYAVTVV
ncbi:MAG TPA: cadherin-like beta sandwich domain-containing protein, partial [Bacteroides sp.]|nr:cadherin-like beta sandwich domain-containing protein [Bacteroides sp.]